MTNSEKLSSLRPVRLVLGYDKEGRFSSILCECKEDLVRAMGMYESFRVFKLIESESENWYRNKVAVFEKMKG